MESVPNVTPREKRLLRRLAAGLTDIQIATELGDKASRIAAQRQRLAEKFDIRTPEQLSAVTNELAHHPYFKPQRQRCRHKVAAAARDADLRPILETIRDRTYREIAEDLTDRGIKTRRGGDVWKPVTVMRAMKRLGIAGK
jgi:DNA-binding CsgD family transcriptional regulator